MSSFLNVTSRQAFQGKVPGRAGEDYMKKERIKNSLCLKVEEEIFKKFSRFKYLNPLAALFVPAEGLASTNVIGGP